jgi:hypothetical protein
MNELKRQFNNNARIADGKFQYLNYNFFNAEKIIVAGVTNVQ